MKVIERITKISEEIWRDMCGEESSYEVDQKAVLHSSESVSDNAGGRETDN